MVNLFELQCQLQANLTGKASNIANYIVKTKFNDAKERLSIYSSAYQIRLIDALKNTYPALVQYLDVVKFEQMARQYIDIYPSKFYSICSFGDKLAEFLYNDEYYAKWPILAELANFEWIRTKTFDEADAQSLTVDDIRQLEPQQWPDLVFKFHPTIKSYNFKYNTITLWNSLLNKQIKLPVKQLKQSQKVVFWRCKFNVLHRSLTHNQAFVLDQAITGVKLSIICDKFSQIAHEPRSASQKVAMILMQWVAEGMIIGLCI